MLRDDFLWVEKFRPRMVADTILPKSLKAIFQSFVDNKNIPTLLLTGPSGVGKTTIARAMLDELGCDYIMINGSLEGRLIDTLRTTIVDFASTVSFSGGRKIIVIDEADYMNAQSVQPAPKKRATAAAKAASTNPVRTPHRLLEVRRSHQRPVFE